MAGGITDNNANPTFRALQMKWGTKWCVLVVWPDGREQELRGFESEIAAEHWIARGSVNWLEAQEKKRQTNHRNRRHDPSQLTIAAGEIKNHDRPKKKTRRIK